MSVDYSDCTLVRSNAAQIRTALENHREEWGAKYGYSNIELYADKDARLAAQYNQRDKDAFVHFCLVPRSDPETADILAGCETFKRKGAYLPPGETEPVDTISYGIASVYCNPKHRGKGWPRHMLRLLHYVIAVPEHMPPFPTAWGAPPAIEGFKDARFSVLYSGVGKVYYAKCTKGESEPGWMPIDRDIRVWNVQPDHREDVSGLEWAGYEDLPKWEKEAERRMWRDLAQTGDASKTRLVISPELMFENHALRYTIAPYARSEPPVKNVLLLPGPDDSRPFAVYYCTLTADGKAEQLFVMHVSGDVPLSAMIATGRKEGVRHICCWEPTTKWDQERAPDKNVNDNLTCIAQYGFGGDDKVEWEHNEEYAWM